MDASIANAGDERSGAAGRGRTPQLTLDGFSGPLARLLALARAHQIDLARLSLAALLDQLAAALRRAPAATPLGEKGDWVVMAARLVQLRSLLLLPAAAPARRAAEAEAGRLRARLVELRAVQALAGWLDARPRLGRDAFARGRPEVFGVAVEAGPALDVIEFLWAGLALFDDEPAPDTAPAHRPRPFAPYPAAEARDRILRLLAGMPGGGPLGRFLPDPPAAPGEDAPGRALRRRSAWASTLAAGLELARRGEAALGQGGDFTTIHVGPAAAGAPSRPPHPKVECDGRACWASRERPAQIAGSAEGTV